MLLYATNNIILIPEVKDFNLNIFKKKFWEVLALVINQ